MSDPFAANSEITRLFLFLVLWRCLRPLKETEEVVNRPDQLEMADIERF